MAFSMQLSAATGSAAPFKAVQSTSPLLSTQLAHTRPAAVALQALLRPTPSCKLPSHRPSVATQASATEAAEIAEVEALKGIRTVPPKEEGKPPGIEYLVKWKDGSPDTWEPVTNLADNLLRDYEQRWWGAVRKGDEETMSDMLEVGGPVLARTVEEGIRSALHYAAALGKADMVKRLLAAGAEINLADKDGYTPLHMAAGYLHTSTINALIAGGADPEQEDRQGRSPLVLVESFRAALPPNNPLTAARRLAVEDVLKVLTDNLFEDVEPEAILDVRTPEDEEGNKKEREFLVKYKDEEEPEWTAERYLAEDVIEDYESGLEYAQAESIIDVRNRGDSRTYLVRWSDDYPDSWEEEENVSQDLIKMFEEKSKSSLNEAAVAVAQ